MFAIGFVLGTFRVFVLSPTAGPFAATLIELPIMLGLSWVVCSALIRRHRIGTANKLRLAMGAIALGVLLALETLLGIALLGRTLAGQLDAYAEAGAALGLAAQLAFALFPLVQARTISR
jgi:hypothetical protein